VCRNGGASLPTACDYLVLCLVAQQRALDVVEGLEEGLREGRSTGDG